MKTIVVRAPGGLDRLESVDTPNPGDPGPGAIRVRLHASSLNYHDYGVVIVERTGMDADPDLPRTGFAGIGHLDRLQPVEPTRRAQSYSFHVSH